MAEKTKNLSGLDESLYRDLTAFLTFADEDHELDSPQEAAKHAENIKGALEGSGAVEWNSQFGSDNLKSWYDQFQWLAKPENFLKWNKWKGQAVLLRTYLLEQHLYQFPTHYFGIESKDPKQLYYRNPASAIIEEKIVEAIEKAGSAQKIIDTIEALKAVYPGEFNGFWDEFFNFQKVRPFDGREPYNLSTYLDVVAEIGVRKDMLAFIRRVDSFSGKQFTFQTASRYFRYHDQWLKTGEAFFVKLEKRSNLEKLFEDYGILQYVEASDLDQFAELDPKLLDELKGFIDEAGVEAFFLFNYYFSYQCGLSDQLRNFLGILQEKGAGWLRNIHRSCHIKGASLECIPFYRLVATLEKELGDIQPILPYLDVLASSSSPFYWFYTSYDEYFLQSAGRGRESETFLKDLVPAIVALHKQGLLLPLLKDFKQREDPLNLAILLALLGKEFQRIAGNEFFEKTVDVDPLHIVDLKSKIFWAQTALQTSKLITVGENPSSTERQTIAMIKEQYGTHDLNLPRPSETELKRFEKWLDRVSPDSNRRVLLYHILLSQNGGVPSEEALGIYEREILSETDDPWTLFIFGRLDGSLWKEAPHAIKGILYFISENSSGWASSKTFSALELLKDPEVRQKLKDHENFLNRFSQKE